MIDEVKPWRPISQSDVSVVAPLVSGALERWSKEWFPSSLFLVKESQILRPSQEAAAKSMMWRSAKPWGLGIDRGQLDTIVELALDGAGHAYRRNDLDSRIVNGLAEKLFDDLLTSLDSLIALHLPVRSSPGGWLDAPTIDNAMGGISMEIGFELGRTLARLYLPLEVIAVLRPVPGGSDFTGAALDTRSSALGTTSVTLHPVLGYAKLGLIEFANLSAGDVIVLDRPLSDVIEVKLGDRGDSIGAATIISLAEQLGLQFILH